MPFDLSQQKYSGKEAAKPDKRPGDTDAVLMSVFFTLNYTHQPIGMAITRDVGIICHDSRKF